MFTSNKSYSDQLYKALKTLKTHYNKLKTLPKFTTIIKLCTESAFYSSSSALEKFLFHKNSLNELITVYAEPLLSLNEAMHKVEKLARCVEHDIFKKSKSRLPWIKNQLPQMMALQRIADHVYAHNEVKDDVLLFISIGQGMRYYPHDELINDCWIIKSEREKINKLLVLLDIDKRREYFDEIEQAIIQNIKQDTQKENDVKRASVIKYEKENMQIRSQTVRKRANRHTSPNLDLPVKNLRSNSIFLTTENPRLQESRSTKRASQPLPLLLSQKRW
ncbi:MAG: hypothetical protein JO149_07935 [Gammaproteobacteria bacterium]|nr:hypothetical protein [Gammaproteobacteria bacterium]